MNGRDKTLHTQWKQSNTNLGMVGGNGGLEPYEHLQAVIVKSTEVLLICGL